MEDDLHSFKTGPTSRLRFSSDSIARESSRSEENLDLIGDHFRAILRLLGEDPDREGEGWFYLSWAPIDLKVGAIEDQSNCKSMSNGSKTKLSLG